MPILRLSDEVSDVLQKLVIERKGVSELLDLSAQLSTPLLPPIEDSQYPPGTIVDHRSLVKASQWAALHDDTASRDELRLSRLLRGAEIAMPMLPKPERVGLTASGKDLEYIILINFFHRSLLSLRRYCARSS